MLLKNPNPFISGQKLQIDLKSNLEFSELDFDFYIGRMKNDARVISEVKQLREARRELKEFESDMTMPNHFKLKEFRKLAKDVIEGGTLHKNRNASSEKRTEFEEERLRDKIAELEAKYPHVDLSQLLVSDKADDVKKAMHKQAFASYKAYEFLKHGINTA